MSKKLSALFAAALLCATAFATAALAAPAGDAASAKAFVARLYAHYPSSEAHPFSFIDHASQTFDAPLLALIARDRRLAGGEVGALDADPLCQCQDDSGMHATITSVTLTGPAAAQAQLSLRFTLEKPVNVIAVKLSLVLTKGGWRIHDISSKDTPSLRAYLSKHAGGR